MTPPPTACPPGALVAEGLERRFTTRGGETVGVCGVSLCIPRGETVALLGPNGSGKSTLLGMLATIDAPDRGTVTIDGITLGADAPHGERALARARLGVVFQTHVLDPLLTVRENLLIGASLYAIADAATRIDRLLGTLRVADRAHDRVGTLSGGLARRADLARALLHDPAVLLLDEPTTGLDPEARADLLDTLDDLASGTDAPAILHTTHLTDEAERSDRVLILQGGRIVREGSPADLRASLGDRTLVLERDGDTDDRSRLEALGLGVRAGDDRRTIASLPDDEGAARIVRTLLDENRRFRVGPPSLDDVYGATVGREARDGDRAPGRTDAEGGAP
jgi:ABC-2 type transport system ATP-binding protein